MNFYQLFHCINLFHLANMNNIVENRLIDLNFNFDRRDDMNLIQKTSYIDNFDTKTSIDSHTHLTNFRNYNIKIIAFEKKKKKFKNSK